MATTYQSVEVINGGPARLVSIGFTPKYKELTPATLAINDVFEFFFVPGGVRIFNSFIRAVGGTGLDTNGAPTLTIKVDVVDDNGTTNLIPATSGVRAAGGQVDQTVNKGYKVVSAKNNAKIKVTATAASATLGTSKIGVGATWSSYPDDLA